MNPNNTLLRRERLCQPSCQRSSWILSELNLLKTIEHFVCYLTGMKLEVGLSGYLLMPLISAMTDSTAKKKEGKKKLN